jgi:hypothetical protein
VINWRFFGKTTIYRHYQKNRRSIAINRRFFVEIAIIRQHFAKSRLIIQTEAISATWAIVITIIYLIFLILGLAPPRANIQAANIASIPVRGPNITTTAN